MNKKYLGKYKRIGIVSILITLIAMFTAIMNFSVEGRLIYGLVILVLGFFAIIFNATMLLWRKGLVQHLKSQEEKEPLDEEAQKEFDDRILVYEKSLRQITWMGSFHVIAVVILFVIMLTR